MRISYLLADFLGKKVFLQQNNPNNNRNTTDKWSITLRLAQASVSLEVQQSEGPTGESTVNQLTVTLNLQKKLMVKRAKFSLTMCNLRSKQGTLQRFIRKSFAISKKYAYLCSDSSHHASHLHNEPGWDFCFLQL